MSKQQKQKQTRELLKIHEQNLTSKIDELNAIDGELSEEQENQLVSLMNELAVVQGKLEIFEEAEQEIARRIPGAKKQEIKIEVKPEDKGMYHVALRMGKPVYNAAGEDTTQLIIQKFTPADYNHFMGHAKRLGYRTEVLHDPRKTV